MTEKKQDQYFAEKPTSELRINQVKALLRKHEFEFHTGSGVFASKKIDRGTKVLIDWLIMKEDWKVLDLGCGYGPVGIVVKKLYPLTEVFMSDINERAVMLARTNAKSIDVEAHIKQGNLYEPFRNEKFDTIIVNPPQIAGRALCYKIIEDAPGYLADNGLLQLVARHNKGGAMLEKKMKGMFGNVRTIKKSGGFRIYVSEKNG